MQKPEPITVTFIDYFSMIEWICHKYELGEGTKEIFNDFFIRDSDINNGELTEVFLEDLDDEDAKDDYNPIILEVLLRIKQEFGEYADKYGNLPVKVWW